ncbi:MAG: hypothetical protein ACRDZ1_11605, partial [Acidimicrobiia bacterium]
GTARRLRPVRLASGTRVDLAAGDDAYTSLVAERRRLEAGRPALAHGCKVAANALAHGIVSRFDRGRYQLATPARVVVAAGPGEHAETRTRHVERAGPWTFPPAAAIVTAGARLVLAMLERALADAGATVPWAWCDTDGAGVIATPAGGLVACAGGPDRLPDGTPAVRAVGFDQLRHSLDGFTPLNVLGEGSPWRVEHQALDEPLEASVVALKRYCLVRDTPGGVEIVGASEHGLAGVLADPYQGERDEHSGVRRTVVEAWQWLLDPSAPQPACAGLPALEPRVAGTPAIAAQADVRPGAFYYQARPPLLRPGPAGGALLAPYEPDRARWASLAWSQRGKPIVTRAGLALGETVRPGTVPIGTLGDELTRYRLTALPAGWAPVTAPDATGDATVDGEGGPCVLAPALVASDPARRVLVGREAFAEPEHGDQRLRALTYGTCAGCGIPLPEGRTAWCSTACHDAHDGSWRRRRLADGQPRCVATDDEEPCPKPVSRRGALCEEHRRARDRDRKRLARHRVRLERCGPDFVLCATLGCGRQIIGPGGAAARVARRDKWHQDQDALLWSCPRHKPRPPTRPCRHPDCEEPTSSFSGMCHKHSRSRPIRERASKVAAK